MTQETVPEIPDQIREVMRDEEIRNMQSLDGWAVGHVTHCDNRIIDEQIENAWIELFNGEGRADEFGGVRFMAIDDSGDYREAYAYGSKQAMIDNDTDNGWYVHVFMHPENPTIGQEAPR